MSMFLFPAPSRRLAVRAAATGAAALLLLAGCAHAPPKAPPVPPPPASLVSGSEVALARREVLGCLERVAHAHDDGVTALAEQGRRLAAACRLPLDRYARQAAGQTHDPAGAPLLYAQAWHSGEGLGQDVVTDLRRRRAGLAEER